MAQPRVERQLTGLILGNQQQKKEKQKPTNTMIKKLLIVALVALTATAANAQRYMTRTGQVSFYSHTSMEDIQAVNNQVSAVLDPASGSLAYTILIKSFQFEKALMQEHFNENYMESDKYPKSTFAGKIKDMSGVDLTKDGEYKVEVEGKLTMKDKTNAVSVPGTIAVKGGKVTTNAKFNVKPEDYNIEIPAVVKEKIAKEIEITVNVEMAPMVANK
jgi:polyisoprenoid-binding protein YceI